MRNPPTTEAVRGYILTPYIIWVQIVTSNTKKSHGVTIDKVFMNYIYKSALDIVAITDYIKFRIFQYERQAVMFRFFYFMIFDIVLVSMMIAYGSEMKGYIWIPLLFIALFTWELYMIIKDWFIEIRNKRKKQR